MQGRARMAFRQSLAATLVPDCRVRPARPSCSITGPKNLYGHRQMNGRIVLPHLGIHQQLTELAVGFGLHEVAAHVSASAGEP